MIIIKIYSNLHEMNIESNRYSNNSRVPRMILYIHTEGSDDCQVKEGSTTEPCLIALHLSYISYS